MRSRAEVEADLAAVRAQVQTAQAAADDVYERRVALYREARQLDPPMTMRALADSQGVTETAVIQALRTPEEKAAARARKAARQAVG